MIPSGVVAYHERARAEELYRGVTGKMAEIDALIAPVLLNFSMERLGGVDRNILRVAVYEMHFCDDVPPVVAISEAIEVAKRFGGPDSGRFINGVLDKLKEGLARPLRVPAPRCVLVEDTLQHQKAARRVGMTTVWMQRWTRAAGKPGMRLSMRPPYVDLSTRRLRELRRRLR